jgi:hypothetical protein
MSTDGGRKVVFYRKVHMNTEYIFNNDMATDISKSLWSECIAQYGSHSSTPASEASAIGEMVRAIYVLQVWQRDGGQGSPVKTLHNYAITESTINKVVERYFDGDAQEASISPTPKRANKYGAFEQWAESHLFEQFTTEQLVEQSGFSYATTLKYIQESPTFRKVKKGLWEVRDAKADREAEKKSSL